MTTATATAGSESSPALSLPTPPPSGGGGDPATQGMSAAGWELEDLGELQLPDPSDWGAGR